MRFPSGDHFGPLNSKLLSRVMKDFTSCPFAPISQYCSSFQKAIREPSGENAPCTPLSMSLRTSPASVEITQRAMSGRDAASPSARILVPSRDHEKRAQIKQKSDGTTRARLSPVSINRMRIAFESLYATNFPSGDIAAKAIGSSVGLDVICLSRTSNG